MNAVDSLTPTAAATATTTNSKIVSAILFDIDGTLVNTDSIHYAVFREFHQVHPSDNNNNNNIA